MAKKFPFKNNKFSEKDFSLDNVFQKNRRGLSTIIVTLILILVSLVAIGIFWVVINNLIKGSSENIGLGRLTLSAEIKRVVMDNSTNNITLTVGRNVGEGELAGIKFLFYSDTGTEVITEITELSQLDEKQFSFQLTMDVDNITKISIAPVFDSSEGEENVGNIIDTYDVEKEGFSLPPGLCDPTTNPCGSAVCGTAINGTCGTVSCGTCETGYECIGGACVSEACTPAVNPCGTNECGTAKNGTCVDVNCGIYGGGCQTEYTCIAGTCEYTPSDLVALYHLDRNSGAGESDTNIYDWSGNGNNCTASGAIYTASGRTNGGYSFDGYGDYLNCGNKSSLSPDSITISVWARSNEVNNLSDRYLVHKVNSYFIDAVRTYAAIPHFYVYNATSSNSRAFPTMVANQWVHLVGVYNESNIRIFVNGSLTNNIAFQGPVRKVADILLIGSSAASSTTTRSFNGTIDEVSIYNRALSDAEVQALYSSY